MKAGAQLAIVDPDAVSKHGITPHQPNLGDPKDPAPAALPAPHFFATSRETKDERQSGGRHGNTPGQTQDQAEPDVRRRDRRVDPLNAVLLVGILIVSAVFIARLIEAFSQVIGSFR